LDSWYDPLYVLARVAKAKGGLLPDVSLDDREIDAAGSRSTWRTTLRSYVAPLPRKNINPLNGR
jgi:hypothetical protein